MQIAAAGMTQFFREFDVNGDGVFDFGKCSRCSQRSVIAVPSVVRTRRKFGSMAQRNARRAGLQPSTTDPVIGPAAHSAQYWPCAGSAYDAQFPRHAIPAQERRIVHDAPIAVRWHRAQGARPPA